MRNIAHRLIEEFMLAANEAVAQYLEKRGIGFAAPRARKARSEKSARIRGTGRKPSATRSAWRIWPSAASSCVTEASARPRAPADAANSAIKAACAR